MKTLIISIFFIIVSTPLWSSPIQVFEGQVSTIYDKETQETALKFTLASGENYLLETNYETYEPLYRSYMTSGPATKIKIYARFNQGNLRVVKMKSKIPAYNRLTGILNFKNKTITNSNGEIIKLFFLGQNNEKELLSLLKLLDNKKIQLKGHINQTTYKDRSFFWPKYISNMNIDGKFVLKKISDKSGNQYLKAFYEFNNQVFDIDLLSRKHINLFNYMFNQIEVSASYNDGAIRIKRIKKKSKLNYLQIHNNVQSFLKLFSGSTLQMEKAIIELSSDSFDIELLSENKLPKIIAYGEKLYIIDPEEGNFYLHLKNMRRNEIGDIVLTPKIGPKCLLYMEELITNKRWNIGKL